MYPRDLLESEVKSRGENKVFEALRDGPPESSASSLQMAAKVGDLVTLE